MADPGKGDTASGQLVDAVCYMAMSMRVSPSMHRAILFAARNVEEPLASGLRQAIVDVELRKSETLEEALLDLARTHTPDQEEFQEALRLLRTAELQTSQDGVDRALDRATSTVFEGARRRVKDFADGLQRPVFVLFSIGVVLPLMLGSLLPLMSVGGLGSSPWLAIVLMDVLFPVIFILAARRVLAQRPLVRTSRRSRPGGSPPRGRAVVAALVGAGLVLLGILCGTIAGQADEAAAQLDAAIADGSISGMDATRRAELESTAHGLDRDAIGGLASLLGYLPVLWGVAAAVSVYALPTLATARRRRQEVRAVEVGLPDALFQIGSRVADGMALEPAMRRAATGLEGEAVSGVLRRALSHMTLKRTSASEALFGRGGALTGFPSEHVSASLKTVVEMVRKDVSGAGRAIVSVSDHLRELGRLEREVGSRLRSVTDMMRSTATLFAPAILGITSALYLVVARLAPSLPFSSGAPAVAPMAAPAFSLVLGVFVLALAAATMHFVARLGHGDDAAEARYQAVRALPVAVAVYTVATIIGQTVVG